MCRYNNIKIITVMITLLMMLKTTATIIIIIIIIVVIIIFIIIIISINNNVHSDSLEASPVVYQWTLDFSEKELREFE